MNESFLAAAHPLIILFGTIGAGLAFGRIKVGGLSLGSSGVLFVALLVGHLGGGTYGGVGTIGLVLFVYAVGIGAGGRFFGALARQGSTLALLALLVTSLGALVTIGLSRFLEIPADLAAGIYAGALTSTPALAAASETLGEAGSLVPIGYGIAYPFGVVGVVIFVQLLPRLLRKDLDAEAAKLDEARAEDKIIAATVVVTNREVFGFRIAEFEALSALGVQVTRVRKGDRGVPLSYSDEFSEGLEVLLVGLEQQVRLASTLIGHPSERPIFKDVERERCELIVLDRRFVNQSLKDLHLMRDYGVTVSRITRLGITFVPSNRTILESNDIVTVIGDPDRLKAFSEALGHRSQAFDETDLLSMGIGLTLGVVVGRLAISLPGVGSLSLGLAGGPLLVGLLLGHFGRIGRIVGHIPRPTRLLIQELGLVLFLVEAGLRGGGAFLETFRAYGMVLFVMGAAITLVPMLIAYVVATAVFKINVLQALGGICGGMTSTPALGAITAKTDSEQPVVSYATAYPVALILMTIFAKIVIQSIGSLG